MQNDFQQERDSTNENATQSAGAEIEKIDDSQGEKIAALRRNGEQALAGFLTSLDND